MTVKDDEGLDRRRFMIASVATAGAAGLMATAAAAQTTTGENSSASGKCATFTGDVIDGKRVVDALDIADLEPGKHTRSISRACRCRPVRPGMRQFSSLKAHPQASGLD